MSECRLSSEMNMNRTTPIDNIFISEFMPSAPGEFVKIYMYTLMLCYTSMKCTAESIASDLSMDIETVNNAFKYWARKKLISITPNGYEFQSLHSVVACTSTSCKSLSVYSEFNAALTELLNGRALSTSDLEMAYDWMEIYGMSQGCVFEMVNYAVKHKYKKGSKISFNSLNKMALNWLDLGITTEEKAKDYINSQLLISSHAKDILKHLGQFRNPTVDEYKLVGKWEEEFGFSIEALLCCCSKMLYSQSPSFAVLNNMVEKFNAKGIKTVEQIEAECSRSDEMHTLYKEIVQRSGGYGNATKAQKEMIDELIIGGFGKQGLLYICDYLVGLDKKGLSHTIKLANELREMGITDENDVAQELDKRTLSQTRTREFLETAGFSRQPSKKDMEMYSYYASCFGGNHEVMLKAASLASGAKNRSEHLARLLEQWKSEGITHVNQTHDIAPAVQKKPDTKKDYIKGEKTYTDKDLFDVFE